MKGSDGVVKISVLHDARDILASVAIFGNIPRLILCISLDRLDYASTA
jgi:hypothetical protein